MLYHCGSVCHTVLAHLIDSIESLPLMKIDLIAKVKLQQPSSESPVREQLAQWPETT
jgi:hypothetical protein